MATIKPLCSYCNKDLSETKDNRVLVKIALYLQSDDTTIQVCNECATQVFIQDMLSRNLDTDSLIDMCDNFLLKGGI